MVRVPPTRMRSIWRTVARWARGPTLGAVVVATTVSACVADRERGYALYPAQDPAPESHEVARLVGAVDFVDGQPVRELGSTFELLPGCHVVVTRRNWGHRERAFEAVSVPTGRASFAIPMRAGHEYVVDVAVTDDADPQGAVAYATYERAPDGTTLRRFEPARTEEEIVDCLVSGGNASVLEQPTSGVPDR